MTTRSETASRRAVHRRAPRRRIHRPVRDDPAATFTASGNHHGLVCPAGGTWNDQARSTNQALRALTTREAYALVAPYYGNSDTAHPARRPARHRDHPRPATP